MNYQAVIFDFNGTLIFDTPLHIKAWDTISKSLHCGPITLETILTKYWGLNNIGLLKGLTDHRYTDEEYQQLSKKKNSCIALMSKLILLVNWFMASLLSLTT